MQTLSITLCLLALNTVVKGEENLLTEPPDTVPNVTAIPSNEKWTERKLWLWLDSKRTGSEHIRPVKEYGAIVKVEIAPILATVISVDEVDEMVRLSLTLKKRWNDPFMVWDPAKAVDSITVPCHLLWKPIVLMEATIELAEYPSWEQIPCRIDFNGDVTANTNQVQTIICALDVFLFPFDTQTCSLDYTVWMYDDSKVLVAPMEYDDIGDPVELISALAEDLPEWKIKSYTVYTYKVESSHGEPITKVQYKLVLERRSMHYITNVIIPSFLICMLSIIGLFSPSEGTGQARNEKITLGLTCLLTMSVMLLVVSDDLPKTNEGSLLGHYVIFEFLVSAVATIFATKMVYLNTMLVQDIPLPKWVNFLARMGTVVDENLEVTEPEKKFAALREALLQGQESQVLSESEVKHIQKIYNNNATAMLLDQCLKHIVYIRQLTEQAKLDDDEFKMRSKALCRLEYNMMLLFLAINLIFTVIWFIIGHTL